MLMSMEWDDIEIGNRLKEVRNREGSSQSNFAASLGISLRAYQGYERGENIIPTEAVRELLKLYGVNPSWILTGRGPQQWLDVEMIDTDLFSNVLNSLVGENIPMIGGNPAIFGYYGAVIYERVVNLGDPSNRSDDIKSAIARFREILAAQFAQIVERVPLAQGEDEGLLNDPRWLKVIDLVKKRGEDVDPEIAQMTWIPGGDLERKFVSGEI